MTLHTNLSFETATGSIDYPFTNDYMFRAILQKDKQVLKALIAALLHLKKESIHDVAITNPIELGAAISDKDFILDIRVNLNNEQLIDLEMQMSNEYNWSERSISYAARSFDQLNSGEEYKEVLPVHSIGFLNFTLFEDQPEFFATYELRNKKTGHLYSSKFSIHVLDLTRIDLATAEDQNYEIDRWAKLFKAKTWEELRMIAKNIGMIPDCVPAVMQSLEILTLEIQRMPKNPNLTFGNTHDYPYYSVCTTSTHDMGGIRVWWEEDREKTQRYFNEVLQQSAIFCRTMDMRCHRRLASQVTVNAVHTATARLLGYGR